VQLKWREEALANLDAEAEYISQDSPAAAVRTVAAILDAIGNLKRFPALGRPGRVSGTRELVVSGTPYVVPYRVRGDTIELLLVFHASRRWPSLL
jgi:toxin ParE1/3/4